MIYCTRSRERKRICSRIDRLGVAAYSQLTEAIAKALETAAPSPPQESHADHLRSGCHTHTQLNMLLYITDAYQ
ncbi:hypothetical protein ColTof4_13960 [Colletotrichum tofieldiae]|nr:hypothetical protein ColTof3_14594 [Colletotrichum tofieldiae]GKT81537.1 hypothetical protein ColTof4_13960 [Colletotrichum tofieldiae]